MFYFQNEAKMAADEEKEREKERKKREKSEEYSRELRKQMEGNARRRQKEHELDEHRAKYVWDCDASWLVDLYLVYIFIII